MKYLAYFQAYTNTYDSLENFKAKYEEALRVPDVVGLVDRHSARLHARLFA